MKPRLVFALGLVVLLLAAACSQKASSTGGGKEPPGADPPKFGDVPGARLKDSAGKQTDGRPGSRCWGRMCVDMVGPITQPGPAAVKPGERLEVVYEAGQPAEASYSWLPAPAPAPAPQDGQRVWQGVLQGEGNDASAAVVAPSRPGLYLLLAFARWEGLGKGDISYGFYVEVR